MLFNFSVKSEFEKLSDISIDIFCWNLLTVIDNILQQIMLRVVWWFNRIFCHDNIIENTKGMVI